MKCAFCPKEVRRFSSRGRAYKFCSPECDKKATGIRLSKARYRKPCDPPKKASIVKRFSMAIRVLMGEPI